MQSYLWLRKIKDIRVIWQIHTQKSIFIYRKWVNYFVFVRWRQKIWQVLKVSSTDAGKQNKTKSPTGLFCSCHSLFQRFVCLFVAKTQQGRSLHIRLWWKSCQVWPNWPFAKPEKNGFIAKVQQTMSWGRGCWQLPQQWGTLTENVGSVSLLGVFWVLFSLRLYNFCTNVGNLQSICLNWNSKIKIMVNTVSQLKPLLC